MVVAVVVDGFIVGKFGFSAPYEFMAGIGPLSENKLFEPALRQTQPCFSSKLRENCLGPRFENCL